jgi:hypothetical protein
MKAMTIVAVLLCIATSSQAAFTGAQRTSAGNESPQVKIARSSADYASVSFGAFQPIPEADIAQRRAVSAEPVPPPGSEVAVIAMPFSSLQLSPALVEYLGLTRAQAKNIQRLMDRERPTTEPLMDELRTIIGEPRSTIQRSHNNENRGSVQRLAPRQLQVLVQLMRANSRLQRRIDDVLDSQQRKKLDSFKRASEVTLVDGN